MLNVKWIEPLKNDNAITKLSCLLSLNMIYLVGNECCTTWGRKGFDRGRCSIGSESGVHQPVSKVKLLLNIKANNEYALAA